MKAPCPPWGIYIYPFGLKIEIVKTDFIGKWDLFERVGRSGGPPNGPWTVSVGRG